MSILSEVAEIRDAVAPMSVEFFHASTQMGWIDENVELLRGVPVKKMSKSPLHEFLVRTLYSALEAVLPGGCLLAKEGPLTTADSEPEPDLMVVQGAAADFKQSHPKTAELVIEVSVSTEKRDEFKASIYAEAAVKEYWLVLPEKKQIQVFSDSNGSEYQQRRIVTEGSAISEVIEGFKVAVPGLFN